MCPYKQDCLMRCNRFGRKQGELRCVIREDRELLAQLKGVTEQVTEFLLHSLGAEPVDPEQQRALGRRMTELGETLRAHADNGHVINGYVNGLTTSW